MRIYKIIAAIVLSFLLLINLYIFIDCVIVANIEQKYMFFSIYYWIDFTICIIASLIVPLILFTVFFIVIRKKGLIVVSIICNIVLLFLIFFNAFYVSFSRGGILSETSNLNNYGMYDSFVAIKIQEENKTDFFPSVTYISEDSNYKYEYSYGPIKENFHIELDAKFVEEKFYDIELERLFEEDNIYYRENIYYDICEDNRLVTCFFLDEDNKSIKYIMSYNNGFISQIDSVVDQT